MLNCRKISNKLFFLFYQIHEYITKNELIMDINILKIVEHYSIKSNSTQQDHKYTQPKKFVIQSEELWNVR